VGRWTGVGVLGFSFHIVDLSGRVLVIQYDSMQTRNGWVDQSVSRSIGQSMVAMNRNIRRFYLVLSRVETGLSC